MIKRRNKNNQHVPVRCKAITTIILSLVLFTPKSVVAQGFMEGVDSVAIVVEEYSGGDCQLNVRNVKNTAEYILGRDLTIKDNTGCYVYVNPNIISTANGDICAGSISVDLKCLVTGMNIESDIVNQQIVSIWGRGIAVSGGVRVFDPITGVEDLLKVFVNDWRRAQTPKGE